MSAILSVTIQGREGLPRALRPFVAEAILTLPAFVVFEAPARTTFIVGEAAKYIAGESPRIAVLEVGEDGTLLFALRIDWADALRGWWVGSAAAAGPLGPGSLLRLSDPEDQWLELDAPAPSPALERARWLAIAHVGGDRRLRGTGSTPEDTRLLSRAASALGGVPGVHRRYARALEAERRFDEALTLLEPVASAFEDGAACDRARMLLGLDRPREALEVLDAIPADAHASPLLAAYVRGLALVALSRHEEAVGSFQAARSARTPALSSEDHVFGLPLSAVERKVETLYRLARYDDAIAEIGPLFSARARLLHGRCLEGLERWEEARAQYEKARDLGEPSAITAILDLGRRRALLVQKTSTSKDEAIDVGFRVSHPRFGPGTVLDVEDGAATRVLVELESGAEKWFPAAQLRVLTKGPLR